MLYLQEIEIINMLGCDVAHVCLDPIRPVTLLLTQQDEAFNYNPMTAALEFILTTKYATDESLAPFKSSFRPGACVRIVFRMGNIANMNDDSSDDSDQPCTSRQAREREERRRCRKKDNFDSMYVLRTERHFEANDQQSIMYTLNDGHVVKVSVVEFFKRFFNSVTYAEATLMCLHNSCDGNWLSLIDMNAGAGLKKGDDGNPFEAFVNVFKINADGTSPLLGQLTKKCLEAIEHGILLNRFIILKIFAHVRSLFEYITCFEYTVWFFIPKYNKFKPLQELVIEDLDFKDVKTFIKLNSDNESMDDAAAIGKLRLWSDANHTIKDILLVAFQFALAHACNQPVLILKNLISFRNYQCLKFASAAFFKKTYKDSDVDWTQHNYLQRIVHVSLHLYPSVIIEYPGGVPFKMSNVNVVKCEYMTKEGYWSLLECNDCLFPQNFQNKNDLVEVLEKELN